MDAMPNIHPLQSLQETMGDAGVDPRPLQRASLFNNANDGPAKIIAKVSGVQSGGKREDDGPYFTSNEGIPFPDPAHSKTVGGIPVASDIFLFQKQQHFNRSKNLESMSAEISWSGRAIMCCILTWAQEWCTHVVVVPLGTLKARPTSHI